MGRASFGRFGELLHIILFTEWSHSTIDDGRPAVSFPEKNLVGKYAKTVVYYMARWTLSSASKALTIAAEKREIYAAFARAHFLESTEAISNKTYQHLKLKRERGRPRLIAAGPTTNSFAFLSLSTVQISILK